MTYNLKNLLRANLAIKIHTRTIKHAFFSVLMLINGMCAELCWLGVWFVCAVWWCFQGVQLVCAVWWYFQGVQLSQLHQIDMMVFLFGWGFCLVGAVETTAPPKSTS